MGPRLLVSRCLGFAPCRYDGRQLQCELVDALRPHCEVLTICPEVDAGLQTPRPPMNIHRCAHGAIQLIQATDQRDLTAQLSEFATTRIPGLDIDGAFLKAKSPSCGVDSTPHHLPDTTTVRDSGLFASHLRQYFPWLPLGDEVGLEDPETRHHFLARLFCLGRWRHSPQEELPGWLEHFHRRHKYLLMAYDPKRQKELGAVVAAAGRHPDASHINAYEYGLRGALQAPVTRGRVINAIQHMAGYFQPSKQEKEAFATALRAYQSGTVHTEVPLEHLRDWNTRQPNAYIEEQHFLMGFSAVYRNDSPLP